MALFLGQRVYPVVVVLGATGSGKSKLALEIAAKFNGEIISADSMQVYKGLDIVTNKVTAEEQKLVKHHLLDFVDPKNDFSVLNFRKKVLPIMDNLAEAGKLPVVVGGTHYYIESILWDFLVSYEKKENYESSCSVSSSEEEADFNDRQSEITMEELMLQPINRKSLRNASSPILHRLLKVVDPIRADSLHPNNKRKIIRSLQVFQQTGLTHSKHLSMQHSTEGGCTVSGPLRFPNACLFWVQCEQNVLNKRLDGRVDTMVSEGLLEEMVDFHTAYNSERLTKNQTSDYTQGIFQSIGFKEFHRFLILPEEVRNSENGRTILKECIESMKLVTRRYSKKQIKWINGRFLRKSKRQIPSLHGVDASHVENWDECVREPAFRIVEAILKGEEMPKENLIPLSTDTPKDVMITFFCSICSKTIVGSLQWQIHIRSRKHHKMKKRENKFVPAEID